MTAHLLLHQLMSEYGISVHNSIDESVSEYVVQAVSEDTLDLQEKEEFVGDVILEISSLDSELRHQFVKDLIYTSKQLHSTQQVQQSDVDFPILTSAAETLTSTSCTNTERNFSKGKDSAFINESKESVKNIELRNDDIIVSQSETPQTESSKMEKPPRSKMHVKEKSKCRGSTNDTPTATLSPAPALSSIAVINHQLVPLHKVLSKYLLKCDSGNLDEEMLSYIFEACNDSLLSYEDKKNMLVSCIPELRLFSTKKNVDEGSSTHHEELAEKDKDVIARDVIGVALHMKKLREQASKNAARKSKQSPHQDSLEYPETPILSSECVDSSIKSPVHMFSSDVLELQTMFPLFDPLLIEYIHEVKCFRDKQASAQLLLESDDSFIQDMAQERLNYIARRDILKKEQELKSAEETQKLKSTIFDRYGETEMNEKEFIRSVSKNGNPDVSTGKSNNKSNKKGGDKKLNPGGIFNRVSKTSVGTNERVRYRDGVVASYSGEKMITIKDPKPEYDGGSRGTVKTKGKRGPGFVKC